MKTEFNAVRASRRAFIERGVLTLAATTSTLGRSAAASEATAAVRIGLVTDMHFADKPPAGTRYYRESISKLAEAGLRFEQSNLDFVVELGDFIDAADSVEIEQGYLKTINREFAAISAHRHYVLGNHCVEMLKKEEFLAGVEQEKSYYAFDHGGFHFVVLDACFRGDGQPYGRKNSHWTDANIPAAELEWLEADLGTADKPVIVFAHQRLDESRQHAVKNSAEVRRLFESSGKVLTVFQGHSHKNDLQTIGDIHYCTLVAMVEGSGAENNGYSLLEIDPDSTIRVTGFRKQQPYRWDS